MPLETTEEFVTTGSVSAIDENFILLKDAGRMQSGNIYFADRAGKFKRMINHLGQSGEEYIYLRQFVYDKENQELYVNDTMGKKIVVYDLNGNFKRSFKSIENIYYEWIGNYDRDYLICCSLPNADPNETGYDEGIKDSGFMLLSKQDENSLKIQIPYEKYISTTFIIESSKSPTGKFYTSISNTPLIPYQGSWLLVEASSDTIYQYLPNRTQIPFIVRTPEIQSMNPKIFLYPGVITDRYCFMQTVKMEYDFEKDEGFSTTELVYDKQENAIYSYKVYNGDIKKETSLNLVFQVPIVPTILNNDGIAYISRLEAHDLVDACEKGILKGRLKEIAAQLNEESNPVLMIAIYKK